VPARSGATEGSVVKRAAMKASMAARLAWSLCVACVVGVGGALVLQVLNGTAGLESVSLPAAVAFAVVGALVASRQPRNRVGWLLLAAACAWP
jgi:uncharacterized membrane protein YeiH